MTIRRAVGGNEWANELQGIGGIGETLVKELMELGQMAPNIETSRRFTKLIGLSSQVSIKALRLQTYQVKQ